MKLTESTLTALREQATTNPAVKELLEFYDFVTSNQVYESFVARKIILDKWNEDLITNPVSILSSKKAKDDEADDKKDKEVDRILKFMEKQPMLLAGSQELLEKFTTEEEVALNKDKRVKKSDDRAFKAYTN